MSATDLSFNWGIFDFSDPLFAWKFYRGDLNYALAISDTDSLVDYYRRVERRSIDSGSNRSHFNAKAEAL